MAKLREQSIAASFAGFNFDELAVLKIQIPYELIATQIIRPSFHKDRIRDFLRSDVTFRFIVIYLCHALIMIFFPLVDFVRFAARGQNLGLGISYGHKAALAPHMPVCEGGVIKQ